MLQRRLGWREVKAVQNVEPRSVPPLLYVVPLLEHAIKIRGYPDHDCRLRRMQPLAQFRMRPVHADEVDERDELRLSLVRRPVLVEREGVELIDALTVACASRPASCSTSSDF